MFGSVIGSTPVWRFSRKKGMTEPRLPMTLPYRTTAKRRSRLPRMLLAAVNSLSEQSLVAP
jgi:hypothetical protein